MVSAPPLSGDHPPRGRWSPEAHQAGRIQVDNRGGRAAQVGGCWGSDWNSKACQLGIRVSRDRVEEAMEGDHGSAPVGALPCAQGGKGRSMRRALPFACLSVMVLCFYGGPGFLHEHFWLWSSSLPLPQAVSAWSTAVPFPRLLSKPHIPAPSSTPHPSALVDTRLGLGYTGLWQGLFA